MKSIFIDTENVVSLYFFYAKRDKVALSRFNRYLEYLRINVGKEWELTYDKYDFKFMCEQFPKIFSFDGKMMTFKSDREALKSFLRETPPKFIDKALTLSKEFFIKNPEESSYNYNENRSL